MKKIIIVCSIFFLIYSCDKEYTRIDGSSKSQFDKSLESVSVKLTVLQQDKMQEALKFIYKFKTQGDTEQQRWEQVYRLLDKKKADQVLELAEKIAKENKISWSGTSMNTLDESVFEEDNESLSKEDLEFKQIDRATKIHLTYVPVDKNKDLNDGFYLYPALVDDQGSSIEFKNLPLELIVSFVNNGTLVYVIKKTIISSEAGEISKDKGIKIPYNMFDYDKLGNGSVDVEAKIIIRDKYLYGKLINVPVDLSKTKTVSPIEKEINEQIAMEVVKNFINFIGKRNFKEAYDLMKYSKWGNFEDFSSANFGFGEIESTNFLTTEIISFEKSKIIIFALYQFRNGQHIVKTVKQNFILKKLSDSWYITDIEMKEIKDDIWK